MEFRIAKNLTTLTKQEQRAVKATAFDFEAKIEAEFGRMIDGAVSEKRDRHER